MKTMTIRMRADDTAELLLYDQIGKDVFFGEGITAKVFREQIKGIKAKTINLRINSPGGDVTEAVAMMSTLDAFPGRIEVDVDGLAASAATVVMMAGDVIRVASNALIMIHAPHAGVMGGSGDMRRMADLLDKVHGQILDAYERKSKAGREQLSHWMNEETWFTGQGAVDAGLADSVTGAVAIAAMADQLKIAARLGATKVPAQSYHNATTWRETEKRKAIAAKILGAIPRRQSQRSIRGGFNEDQERDEQGRFGSGGGDGGDRGDGKGGGNSQRDREDNDRQDQRDAEDERITEERDAEDRKVDDERAAEDVQYEAELQAVEAQREREDEESQAERDDKDGQDQLDRAEEDKSITAEREAQDSEIDARADRGEITPEQQDAMHERNAEKRDAEDEKRDAAREKEDEKDVAQREKEDARVQKDRDKEDEKRQAENDRVDEQRASQDEKRDTQREKEDAKREALREKEDAKIEKEREKEDKGRARARAGAKKGPRRGKEWAETEKRKSIATRMAGPKITAQTMENPMAFKMGDCVQWLIEEPDELSAEMECGMVEEVSGGTLGIPGTSLTLAGSAKDPAVRVVCSEEMEMCWYLVRMSQLRKADMGMTKPMPGMGARMKQRQRIAAACLSSPCWAETEKRKIIAARM